MAGQNRLVRVLPVGLLSFILVGFTLVGFSKMGSDSPRPSKKSTSLVIRDHLDGWTTLSADPEIAAKGTRPERSADLSHATEAQHAPTPRAVSTLTPPWVERITLVEATPGESTSLAAARFIQPLRDTLLPPSPDYTRLAQSKPRVFDWSSTLLANPQPSRAMPAPSLPTSSSSRVTNLGLHLAAARPVPGSNAAVPTTLSPVSTALELPSTEDSVPLAYGRNLGGTLTVSINNVVRADRFYAEGYTGANARVANIEGGTPWRGHETLNWVLAANIFASGSALTEATGSIHNHATAVSHNMVGKAPANATDPTLQRGIAYGVPASNYFAGNIAFSISGTGFSITNADLRNVYHAAVVTGVSGNAANRVDVFNSSWGGSSTGHNLNIGSKIVDAVLFEGNQTRGSTGVFAAGNAGPTSNQMGRPSTGFNMIAVAALGEVATDAAGTISFNVATTFSDRGPITVQIPTSASATTGTSVGAVRARIDIAAPGYRSQLATYSRTTPNSTAYAAISGTSFAAPTVAGGVALLADYAHTALSASDGDWAVDGRVIRAVLINSADKTSGWSNAQTWNGTRWTTSQGLDYVTGGGRMNLDQAFQQYANVPSSPVTQLINPTLTAATSVTPTGWARATLDRPVAANTVNADFVTSTSLTKYSEFNATLNWFVNGTSTSAGSSNAIGFHNLDLEIWRADVNGAPTTLVAKSTAAHNNVEHLSFLLPENSLYLIRVTRPGGATGTYYSFTGDTTSDVFGLAWMNRPSLLVSGAASVNAGGTQTETNVLISPDSVDAGNLAVTGAGTRLEVLNRLLLGGTDYGAGAPGTLTISSSAAVNVSNQIRVFNGSALNVTAATLSGGVLTVDAGATFTLAGAGTTLLMSRIDISAPVTVPSLASVTILSFTNSSNANSGRFNLSSAAATFEIDGSLTVQSLMTGSSGLTKNGSGTLILAPSSSATNSYTGITQVNAGTLRLGTGFGLPTSGNVNVASGAIFDASTFSNTRATAIGTLTMNGGTFRVPSGSSDYYLRTLAFNGGTANFTGTTNFELRFVAAGTAIQSIASSVTSTLTSSGTSAVLNDFTAAVDLNIAAGTTPSGIDLDAAVIFSSLGTSGSFNKIGAGTIRLTNTANSANFNLQSGRLRVDNMAAFGIGAISFNGGILTYGGATASSTKAFTITSSGGTLEVAGAGATLTLNGTGQVGFGGNTFTKAGAGTLVLAGSNTGSAAAITNVSAGRLGIAVDGAIPAGSTVRVQNGGTLDLAASPTATVDVRAGGTLLGIGGLATSSSLIVDGMIAPGASLGQRGSLTIQGNVSLNAGGSYTWDVNALPTGIAGTNWDVLISTGSLGGSATSANRFAITANAVGSLAGFDNTGTYTWTIATFDGALSLDATAFSVNPQGWTDANDPGTGILSVLTSGNALQVQFAPVPEPGMCLVIGLLGFLAFWNRRRFLLSNQSKMTVLRS